eukprot:SAG31_NODE_2031_length_6627_cov_1.575368_3_plen_191_part_00
MHIIRYSSDHTHNTWLCQKVAGDDSEEAARIFDLFDSDGSGTIDIGELAAVASALGKKLKDSELVAAVAEMDKDGDGTVDKDEFEQWWQQQIRDERRQASDTSSTTGGSAGIFNGGSKAIRRQLRVQSLAEQLADATAASLALHYGFAKVPGSGAGRRAGPGFNKGYWKRNVTARVANNATVNKDGTLAL